MTDAVDISTVILTPPDVRDFPVTKAITALTANADGLTVQFDGNSWPDIVPAGWTGPVYFTIYIGAKFGGDVRMAASLNVYRGQTAVGGDVTNLTWQPDPRRAPGQYANNLYYLNPALGEHTAVEGETLYLMVVAGGWRGIKALSVSERSNIVAFTASSSPKTFTYAAAPPVVVDPPVDPPVAPPVVPPVVPPDSLAKFLAAVDRLEAVVNVLKFPDYETHLPIHGYVGTLDIVLKPKV